MMTETRPLTALRPHPKNAAIYGDSADSDLVESVRAKGILTPLLIASDGTIISGHRRYDAAHRVPLECVPIVLYGSNDPLDIIEALIESNRQRDKTGEQLGREAQELTIVHSERARLNSLANLKQNAAIESSTDVVNLPPRSEARKKTRDVVGDQLGVSGSKAERAARVVQAIDTLKDEGKTREAGQLLTTLNTKSVQRAYTQAQEAGHIAPSTRRASEVHTDAPVTLEQWNALSPDGRASVLTRRSLRAKFNKQEEDHIEWALHSWNPVTGCLHNCSYCYARDIAERFYAHRFVPAFLPDRLSAPHNTPVPAEAQHNVAYRNVFTCSMADLFGKWVPAAWIEAVLDQVRSNPQWNFLFLTKFPLRLTEFEFPDNAWLGTSIDAQARIPNAEKVFARVRGGVKWLSCEPMLERLTFTRLDLFNWVVIGGASRSTQTPEFRPPREWVEHLETQAKDAGCKVYEKTNLLERKREYPGQPAPAKIVVPDAFKMGYLQRDVTPVEMAV